MVNDSTSEDAFIEHLFLAPGRSWAERYFDMIASVIHTTKLPSDDRRIVTSITKTGAYFPVTINHRYVLSAENGTRNNSNAGRVRIICGRAFESRTDLHDGLSFAFTPLAVERKCFMTPPITVWLRDMSLPEKLEDAADGWQQALATETKRARSSPYKRYHNPFVYQAAADGGYRNALFSFVFG